MKIVVDPADQTGCGHYRLIWAARHLQSLGHDVLVRGTGIDTGVLLNVRGDKKDPEIIDVRITEDATENTPDIEVDVWIVQRVSHNWHRQVIPLLRKKGIAVVIDMDDDLTSLHQGNTAFEHYRSISPTPFSAANADFCCKAASWITVSTSALMNVYAKHKRGSVIDNYVPESSAASYIPPSLNDKPVVGWPGVTESHPTDLQVCGRAVQQLIDAGYPFKVVGPPSKVKEKLRLSADPYYTGRIPIDQWIPAIGRELDVVMAPLDRGAFNTAKSRLKPLEANAAGRVWVGSSRAEYRRYARESGGGLLADSPNEWFRQLKRLLDDETLRNDMAAKGHAFAQTQTIEKNSWRWLEAWTEAYKVEHPREVLV